ncbi:hypothetical protein AJ80_03879 [Polytolypa hystricis UAMH7299]|uniref:Uncharacterized protein n=1 Tax=Polytolypa hystricis (strain UAMH7299) TaxID=1447883 RepID=A0A2B7YES8_POLH7|nr:hypothetical protein AJ80_03879 [Polytolypa hystricis UAMH7299]
MGSRAVDSIQCFTFLRDNVPSWITRVTDLAAHTAAKHAEFAAEYTTLANPDVKPKRRKNSSVHSIRPDDLPKSEKEGSTVADKTDGISYMDPLTLLKMSKRYPQEAAMHRKRTQDQAASSNDNADRATRPRYHVVVHYDSQTQSTLEQLVRDIGGARNNIRKGRMNQMMKNSFGFKMSGSGLSDPKSKRSILKGAKAHLDSASKPEDRETGFDRADKQLEQAQSFCESAAHLFLRHGECAWELERTRDRFSAVLELAKAEVERLTTEAKEEEERRKECETSEPSILELESEPIRSPKEPDGMLATIEVDDASSTSSISIDITAFRSARFRT